ncbi:MAG: tetratricopeptide repeat protein [Thermodesulfobacteriota bacterium]
MIALARRLVLMALVLGLVGLLGASARAQIGDLGLRRALVQSYDLLEAGKLAEAKQIYQEILEQHPNNPLALNNLGAIYVREKDYQRALNCLERALPRARDYKALINRVCDVDGVCLAFRPAAVEYGNHELEPLIAANIAMVKAKFAASQKWD